MASGESVQKVLEIVAPQEGGSAENVPVAEVHVTIDRSQFVKKVSVQALRVPKGVCHQMVKKLSKFKAEYPKVRNVVVEEGRPDTRLILLGENINGPDLAELPVSIADELKANPEVEVTQHEIVLHYDSYTAEQVLREVLPPGTEIPSSFETIGHVAHVNLRDEVLPYKKVIGAVLLEKNFPRIRTVLNKVGTIENEFRVPTFEVLAGDPSTVTEVKQHTARFQLDYAQVYWNSRLEYEHMRLVEQFKREDVICDMFAGIGPFAIPAALKGCAVYANDLNPQSTHYLAINSKLNKVSHRVRVSTLDAREFVRLLVRPLANQPPLPQTPASGPPHLEAAPSSEQQTLSRISNQGEKEVGERAEKLFGDGSLSMPESTPRRADAASGEVSTPSRIASLSEGEIPRGVDNGATESGSQGGGLREGVSGVGSGEGQPGSREGVQSSPAAGGDRQEKAAGVTVPPAKSVKGGKPPAVRPPKDLVAERPQRIDHVVMNLPASGIEFLDVFIGLFDRAWWGSPLPRIHCYCFARAFETDADVIRRAEEALGGAIPDPVVWNVRDVAPNKTMLCVSFTLPDGIGFKRQPVEALDGAQSPLAQAANGTANDPTLNELPNLSKKSRMQ